MVIRFLLVDGLNLIRRIHAAQPGDEGFEKVESARSACLHSLERALREVKPTHAAVVFDGGGPGWRRELHSTYKAGRSPMPGNLAAALPDFRDDFLRKAGVSSIVVEGVEADDVIATMAVAVARRSGEVTILSTDKNYIPLLSRGISLRDHFAKVNQDHGRVKEKYGVYPEQILDVLALTGDSASHISGVPSIGLKTASRLVTEIGPLEDILAVAHAIPGKTGEMLRRHSESARLARRLLSLRTDIPLGLNLRDFRLKPPIP